MESIFGAYDIRGVFGKDITTEVCEKIGKAVGSIIEEDEFVAGYDVRTHSPKVFDSFVKGLTSTGVDVISIGMVPNPIAYFTGFKARAPGVFITASHNPPEYNGLKFFRGDGSSWVEELKKLKDVVKAGKFKRGSGKISEIDYAVQDYESYIRKRLRIEDGIKIAAECFNGSAALIVPKIFNNFEIGCTTINGEPKGDFGGHRPEPKGANLGTLKKTVLREKANFGVAFDGDCDRSVFVDDKGREFMAAVPGLMFVQDTLSTEKGKIVATIDCPSETSKFVEKAGGQLLWSRIGHGFIEESLIKNQALFGYEQSSHFYFNKFYPFSDGFLATLKMVEILSGSNKQFSQMADEIKVNPTEKLYIRCKDHQQKESVMQKIRKDFPGGKDYVDGIKIFLNDVEWVLIRSSQTNPEINLCVEAKNDKRLKELVKQYTRIVEAKIS
jgi:phosphomannomutase/phosphoglucomutase